MEQRKPDFLFQAYRKQPKGKRNPEHLSSFELFNAHKWKGSTRVNKLYGSVAPLAGLFRLRIDGKWFVVGDDYMFLTFQEAWRIMGTLASDILGYPAAWGDSGARLQRGDRVRVMGAQGYSKTVVKADPWLDEQGIEWVKVSCFNDPIPANAVVLLSDLSKSPGGRHEGYEDFNKAMQKYKESGGTLWYWPEHPDYKHPDPDKPNGLPQSWEVISDKTAQLRGVDPKKASILAMEMGGMSLHQAEEAYFSISS